jgi:hypothetical protein
VFYLHSTTPSSSFSKYWIATVLLVTLTSLSRLDAQEISASGASTVVDTPPTLVWTGSSRGTSLPVSVELSVDGFNTVFYSTDSATGLPINNGRWDIPEPMWSYLPEGTTVSWRAVEPLGRSMNHNISQGTFRVGTNGVRSVPGKTATIDFRQVSKLRKSRPSDGILPEEFIVQLPAQKVASTVSSLGKIAFPVERVTTALGRTLIRFQTHKGADVADSVIASRSAFSGAGLFRTTGELVRDPGPDDVIIQPNFIYTTRTQVSPLVPTDPFFTGTGSPQFQYAPQMVKAPVAWAAGYTGAGVIVAVIDTGLNVGGAGPDIHQEFDGLGKVIPGPDFFNQIIEIEDDNDHGTNVAGIAVAEADGIGMVGIAPDARLMPIKALGAGFEGEVGSGFAVNQAIDYAVANCAKVINMSLGIDSFALIPDLLGFDLLQELAIQNAVDRNVVVCIAAGNDNASLPSSPAAFSDAINVGAIDSTSDIALFSNYGPWVTIVAPGVDMYSADIIAPDSYGFQSGTSQATPVVAGACALLLSKEPSLTAREVKERLQSSADDIGANGRDNVYGFGRLNIPALLGIPQAINPIPPTLAHLELTTDTMVALFTQNLLADGSANAINNPANWDATADLDTWLNTVAGRSISWDPALLQLTVSNSTVSLNPGSLHSLGITQNVVSTGTPRKIVCNDDTSGSQTARVAAAVGESAFLDYSPANMNFTYNGRTYSSVVGLSDGTLEVQFQLPLVKSTAEDHTNYSLDDSPTSTAIPSGGNSVSLAGASFDYNETTRLLRITNLPSPMTVAGTTFSFQLEAGLESTFFNNELNPNDFDPVLGVVLDSPGDPFQVTGVSTQVIGNPFSELVVIRFNKPVRTNTSVYDPSNYSVEVGGNPFPIPADMDIIPGNLTNEIILTGFNFQPANNGQALSVTVSNISDDYGNVAVAPDNTANGVVSVSNFPPQYRSVTASSNYMLAQFAYWIKMDEQLVTDPINWTLRQGDGGSTVVIPLANATLDYHTTQNLLLITDVSLTPGMFFELDAAPAVTKRYNPQRSFLTGRNDNSGNTFFGIIGGDDYGVNLMEDDFVRMVFEMPAPLDPETARVRVSYNAADPADAQIIGVNPIAIDPNTLGTLRIWNLNGNLARNCNSITDGGNYLAPETYPATALGLTDSNRTVEFWIEGVNASIAPGSDRIMFEVDPNGSGNFFCSDVVRVTVEDM